MQSKSRKWLLQMGEWAGSKECSARGPKTSSFHWGLLTSRGWALCHQLLCVCGGVLGLGESERVVIIRCLLHKAG
jgi:hypothetical protein